MDHRVKRHRVVVTGMGVVAPVGQSVAELVDALLAGRSGAGPISTFDPAALPTRIAAEVKWRGAISRDRKMSFAAEAARQAIDDSSACGTTPGADGGLSLGIGLELFSMDDAIANAGGAGVPIERHERMTFLQTPSDLCVSVLAARFGLTAPPATHVSACAAGTDAIGSAARMNASGRRRWMLAGGADSMINPLGVAGFCAIGAMSTSNDEPARASRPFDRRRNGFVLGEGAAMLVLERQADAERRGATIHAEIAGYGTSFDAHGISEPHPEGRGAFQAMSRALADADVEPSAVDAINAHGTSTPKNDLVETMAIKRLLGARAYHVPVSSTKSMIGHLISAAGAVEAVATIGCMNAGWVHPTINLDEPDAGCDLDYVAHGARRHAQQYVLSNSFAFGGQNASLLIRRWLPAA
jgi:3-oxoacyl-[acyl-carrier-protein] synthase II